MKSFDSFLHPERKPNLKFKLSSFPDEFEMRQLSAEEDREIIKKINESKEKDASDALIHYIAESLVVPDLHNADFLKSLSEIKGRRILNPVDALLAFTTSGELQSIIKAYINYSDVAISFSDKVEDAKN